MREAILTLFLFLVTFCLVATVGRNSHVINQERKEMKVLKDIAEIVYSEYTSKYMVNYYLKEASMDDMIIPCKKLEYMEKKHGK